MSHKPNRLTALVGLILAATTFTLGEAAEREKKYGPGVSDTEILIGQTMPYSGPASSLAIEAAVEKAYFDMINERGGVNGRKIRLLSLDDAYNPTKAMEQTRNLVEQHGVLLIFSPIGTPTNAANQPYLNSKQVPHLFVQAGGVRFSDPAKWPWTIPGMASYKTEGSIYARHLLTERPDAKIAILYQNDDLGRALLSGLKETLADRAGKMIVGEAPFNTTDPTVDSQIVALKASGADVLFYFASPKFAAQAIRKTHELAWRPLKLLTYGSAQIKTTLVPAGIEASSEIITVADKRAIDDPKSDPEVSEYCAFLNQRVPNANPEQNVEAQGYGLPHVLVHILEQCGDDLTRENVMRQATNLKDIRIPLGLQGATINISPTNYTFVRTLQLRRFDGAKWVPFGKPYTL